MTSTDHITTAAEANPKWRCLRFTLRSLLIVIAVIGICLGWYTNKTKRRLRAINAVRELGGVVHYHYQRDTQVVGVDLYHQVESMSYSGSFSFTHEPASDDDLQHVKLFKGLERLNIQGSAVTDIGLKSVKNLVNLERLNLSHTSVTDIGLMHLEGLTNLRELNLRSTKVCDMKSLTRLK